MILSLERRFSSPRYVSSEERWLCHSRRWETNLEKKGVR